MDQGSGKVIIETFLLQNPSFLDEFIKLHVTKDRILIWLQEKDAFDDGVPGGSDQEASPETQEERTETEPSDIASAFETVSVSPQQDAGKGLYEGNFVMPATVANCIGCPPNLTDQTLDHALTNKAANVESAVEDVTRKHVCDICHKSFANRQHLKRHGILHSGEKPYKCRECGRGFTQSTHLKAHMLIHTEEWPYACEQCGKAFRTSSNMQKHARFYHTAENQRRQFSCEFCGKIFMWSSNLQRHLHLHSEKKPYECTICDIRYARSDQLKEHQRSHNPEKMFACNQCDKKFTTRSYLKRHRYTHSEDRPFPCDVCPQSFKNVSYLKKHSARHKENKKIGRPKGRGKQTESLDKIEPENHNGTLWSAACVHPAVTGTDVYLTTDTSVLGQM